jgi:hypothetical protein
MFNSKFRRCLVALGVVFLFGVGYHFYNSHVEFREFMRGRLEFNKTFLDTEGLDIETSQHSLDNPDDETNDSTALREQDWSTYNKQEWATHWSNQKPIKVRYARTSMPDDEGVKTVPYEGPPITDYRKDLISQLVETPDGQVHKMYWFEKLKPGQAVPPPEYWPGDKVFIDGLVYDVPPDETTDSYINKIHLSTMYDVPLESVGSLIEEGVIPSSPIDAQNDPLFDDPLFVTREDSRPVEASSPTLPSELVLPNEKGAIHENVRPSLDEKGQPILIGENGEPITDHGLDLNEIISLFSDEPIFSGVIEGVSSGEIDMVGASASEQSPLADDSDNSLADDFEKPKLPESMVAPEKQLTPAEIEAELSKGVSPERFDKAQELFDQYSIEERLRRLRELRESDPDAARQFERERSPKPAHDVPDGEQSER